MEGRERRKERGIVEKLNNFSDLRVFLNLAQPQQIYLPQTDCKIKMYFREVLLEKMEGSGSSGAGSVMRKKV